MSAAGMKNPAMDWRRMAVYLVIGAAVILGGAQFLPQPEIPRVARVASRAGGYAAGAPERVSVRTAREPGVAGAAEPGATLDPDTPVSSDGSEPAGGPAAGPEASGAGEPGSPGVEPAAFEGGASASAAPAIRNLFRPLVAKPREGGPTLPTPPVLAPAPVTLAPTPLPAGPSAPLVPATPPGPSTRDLQMLGVVELGGKPQVLLKNTATGESRYVAKGDEAFGFTVDEIQESQVALKHGDRSQRVMMSSAVTIEGPGGVSTSAGTPGFSGFRSRDGGGGGGIRGGGIRGGNGGPGGGNRGGGNAGPGGPRGTTPGAAAATPGAGGGFSTAEIMSLPTWAERLKKLDEVKAQMEPDRYERLRSFMVRKVEEEKAAK